MPDSSIAPEVDPRGQRYTPTARPGDRLPHAWLKDSQRRISTHQLVDNKGSWALLTDDTEDGALWLQKAAALQKMLGFEINAVRVGEKGDFVDEERQWMEDSGLQAGKGGAVLVRPDIYVAFRAPGYSAEASQGLERVFE